jgi:uncharacterized protein (DUF885 family)
VEDLVGEPAVQTLKGESPHPMTGPMTELVPDRPIDRIADAIRLVEDAWEELRRTPFVQQGLGIAPTRLPDLSFAESERKSAVGKALMRRAAAMDIDVLPPDLALTVRLVRFRAQTWAREADWYWTVTDPMGVGFFGLFHATAYCGGFLLGGLRTSLSAVRFAEPGDLDRYLAIVADFARLIDQMTARTVGQAKRGVRMPKVQVAQARALLTGLKAQARSLGTLPLIG